MSNYNPLVSIIIPVYNVEKYLNQCVDSLLNQTCKNFEIVLVDDGSPDNSPKICDEYAEKDERVKVIHKKNGGLSDARNEGIKNAKGDYLLFLDSDDFYNDNLFLEKLSKIILDEKCEVIIFPMVCYDAKSLKLIGKMGNLDYSKYNICDKKSEMLYKLIMNGELFYLSACCYAISRKFVLDNNLFFQKGIVSEDIEWALRLLPLNFKMQALNAYGVYSRRGREGSITATIGKKNLDDLFNIIKSYANLYRNSKSKDEALLLNLLAYQYAIICGLLARINDKTYVKNILIELKKYKWLLDYNLIPKVKRVQRVSKFIGITNTIYLLQFYINFRGR